ncbi:MAG: hypothetical protein QOI89_3590 [Solirubrobacteraceae bacterium]|jgi:hypothetical protein|nr:hypothetical protein [Solirubrobacteraceae bacterium]
MDNNGRISLTVPENTSLHTAGYEPDLCTAVLPPRLVTRSPVAARHHHRRRGARHGVRIRRVPMLTTRSHFFDQRGYHNGRRAGTTVRLRETDTPV